MMKCPKCGCMNTTRASYCHQCGRQFSAEEQQAAYDRTIYGKIDRLEELKSWITLSKITGNLFVRIGIIAVIALCGILSVIQKGTDLKLLNGPGYRCEYNETLQEYYVYTDRDAVSLSLYIPRTEGNLRAEYYEGEQLMNTSLHEFSDSVTLMKGQGYYILKAEYPDGEDTIKVIVFENQ